MEISKVSKSLSNFYCEICDYKCFRKCDFKKHLLTDKHKVSKDGNQMETTEISKSQKDMKCECGKSYKNKSGLWKHQKKCKKSEENNKTYEENITLVTEEKEEKQEENNQNENMNILINLFQEQLKENKELKELIIEQQKKIMEISAGTNITNNTTNNNKFNLQIFLNEKCKDAFNISDFINGINVSFKDFENFGRLGYVGSINNILIRELKGIDVYKRPFHCSDLKREIIHVKDNNTWVKDEDKKHMKRAIKLIEHKNIKLVPDWLKANPKADDISTKKHEEYMKILDNSMGEMKDEDNEKNYEKIIKNVAKEILIDKEK
jgi:CHAT domain-containing protein